MHLDNTTAIVAAATVLRDRARQRILVVTAKATFSFAGGAAELERNAPEPLRGVDEPTPLGLLPSDTTPRFTSAFEVLLLGCARARAGRPVTQRLVTLSVGAQTRQLVVTGDRDWQPCVGGGRISPPEPFERMPLTWDRAFGGHCDVYLDADSPLEVAHPPNRLGRGFDPRPLSDALHRELRLPTGWPQFQYPRRLANVEQPGQMVTDWHDTVEPAGWSTIPHELGIAQRSAQSGETPAEGTWGTRAHPDWVGGRPPADAVVAMTGLTGAGHTEFGVPQLRLHVDVADATRELVPQMLVLLPEQNRLYLLFRSAFVLEQRASTPKRRARLRVESGWCPPEIRVVGEAA